MIIIDKFNQWVNCPDMAKFILRVGFSGLLLFHGVHKIYAGTAFIQSLLTAHGLPTFIAYGVYVGEVIAPILMIVGIYTRLSAFIGIGTCGFIIYLAYITPFFTLDEHGAWALEPVAVYLFAFLAVMFAGSGKYAIKPD